MYTQEISHLQDVKNCKVKTQKNIPVIANKQPREDVRLQGGSLIELCVIVPVAEKISSQCKTE